MFFLCSDSNNGNPLLQIEVEPTSDVSFTNNNHQNEECMIHGFILFKWQINGKTNMKYTDTVFEPDEVPENL